MNLGSEIEELIEYLKEEENLSDKKKKKKKIKDIICICCDDYLTWKLNHPK